MSCPALAVISNSPEKQDPVADSSINIEASTTLSFADFLEQYGGKNVTFGGKTASVAEAIESCPHLRQLGEVALQSVVITVVESQQSTQAKQAEGESSKPKLIGKTVPSKHVPKPQEVALAVEKPNSTNINYSAPKNSRSEDCPIALSAEDLGSTSLVIAREAEDASAQAISETKARPNKPVTLEEAENAIEQLLKTIEPNDGLAVAKDPDGGILISWEEPLPAELSQNTFEKFIETEENEETPLTLTEIQKKVSSQPLEDSFVQLATLLETDKSDPELEDIGQLLQEIVDELQIQSTELQTEIKIAYLAPETAAKILILLDNLGCQDSVRSLMEMIERHDIKFMLYAIEHLANLARLRAQAEPYEFLSKADFKPKTFMPLIKQLGAIVVLIYTQSSVANNRDRFAKI